MNHTLLKLNSEVSTPDALPVILTQEVYNKITLWTQIAGQKYNRETSGIGTCIRKHGGYYVNNVWLVKPEEVNGVFVAQDPSYLQEVINREFMGSGGEPIIEGENIRFLNGTNPKIMVFCWHTHANFDVFWSGTDIQNALFDFLPNAEWTINLVTNTKGHFLARKDFPKVNHEMSQRGKSISEIESSTPIQDLPVRMMVPMSKSFCAETRDTFLDTHAHVDSKGI